MVTKSGSNTLHGSASFYERDKALQAVPATFNTSAAGGETPPFRRQQYAGTLGGPLVKDKAWWFGAFEYRDELGGVLVGTRDPANQTITNSFASTPLTDPMGTVRGDWQITSKDLLAMHYSIERQSVTGGASFLSGAPIGSASERQDARNNFQTFQTSWTRVLGPTLLNRASFSFNNFINGTDPVTPGIELDFPSIADGASFRVPQQTRQKRLQWDDGVAWTHGQHNLRFGGQVQHIGADFDLGVFQFGAIEFIQDFADFDHNNDGVDSFIRTLYGREFARLYLNRTEKSKVTRALRHMGLESWLDKDSEGSGDFGGAYGVRKRASAVNQELLQWIDRDRRHPFFAFLNYLDVHYSYGGPQGYPKPDWDRGTTIDEYDAGLKYVDDYTGRLLRELEQRGLARNTIVIVTSDHGESLGAHGLTYHGAALYRELIQVPLIISYPPQIQPGLRVAAPVSNTAIAATIMDLLGAGDQSAFPGPSLTALWSPKAQTKWPDPISELAQTDIIVPADRVVEGKIPIATNGWMRSVVTPRWHLITHEKFGHQLYDWTNDPNESRNLMDSPEGRATALRLSSQFDAGTEAP